MKKTNRIGRWMLLLLSAVLLPLQVHAVNSTNSTLSIEAFTMKTGETKAMLIDLNNPSQEVTMVEFYMYLPTGLSVAEEDGELAIDIAGRTTLKKHSLETKKTSSGVIHVLLYSGKSTLISDTSGALLSISLTASSTFSGGDIQLKQQLMTSPDEAKTESKPADYTYTVKIATAGSGIAFKDTKVKALCVANWDTNGDGELSESEAAAVSSLGEVFKQNAEITSFDELQYFTGLKEIGENAFYNCTGLKSIKLPASLRKIGDAAFVGCSGLTTFDFPTIQEKYNFLTLYTGIFTGCTSLVNFTVNGSKDGIIDDMLRVIDGVLFSTWSNSNGKLSSLVAYPAKHGSIYTVPEGTRVIAPYAFCMTEISEVTLPASLGEIWGNAFTYCDKLTKVTTQATIPAYIPVNFSSSTGGDAFDANTAASATLYVPSDGMKEIYQTSPGWGKFGSYVGGSGSETVFATITDDLDMYYKTNGTNTVSLIAIVSNVAKVEIPAQVTHGGKIYTVTEIGSGEEREALYDFTKERYNHFDYTVFEMYRKDEQQTYNVTEVVIPNTVKKIGSTAFRWSKLEKLEIPGSVEEIGPFAFAQCENLVSLKLNKGLKTIANDAFGLNNTIESLEIPEGVTSIGDDAFVSWTALKSVTIPASVEYIGYDAFGGSTANEAVDLHISDANAWCRIQTPNFNGWGEGPVGFYNLYLNDKELTELSIPEGITTLSEIFTNQRNLEKVTIPSTVTDIGYAFFNCPNLKTVVNLTKDPQPIKNWWETVFNARAKTRASVDYDDRVAFDGVDKDACALYVPAGSKKDYSSADGWGEFKNIKSLGDANGDGNVTPVDAIMTLYHFFNVVQSDFDDTAADINGDGTISPVDAIEALYTFFNTDKAQARERQATNYIDPQ